MLLSNCTTVDRVDKLLEGAEYSLLFVRATAAVAFGRVRAAPKGRRLAAVRAFLATAPAVDRIDSILNMGLEGRLRIVNEGAFLQLLQSTQVVVGVPKHGVVRVYLMRRRGIKKVERGSTMENGSHLRRSQKVSHHGRKCACLTR